VHELAIARAILQAAGRHADGRRVLAGSIRVGALRQVVPESLAWYLEIAARDTPCAGAHFTQEVVEARLRCPSCGEEWDPSPRPVEHHDPGAIPLPVFRCPACADAAPEVLSGDELELESIEVGSTRAPALES
jgi:hydrogenase nickel incorporation protein HypA/HybF